jgi:hypothetical protein
MTTDVPELCFRAYVEERRTVVANRLQAARHHLAYARKLWGENQDTATRAYLVKAMAAVEVFEANQEALDVEFP